MLQSRGLNDFSRYIYFVPFFYVMNLSYKPLLSAGTGLAVTVGSIGLGFIFTQPVLAGTKLFTNQMIKVSPDELFVFDLITDDSPTTESHLGYMNPGVVTPNPNAPLPPL